MTEDARDLLAKVRSQARRYESATHRATSEREQLYELIRKARADGASLRVISQSAGLTFARIDQITKS